MARILTFDLSWLSPLLIFIGVIFFLGRKQSRVGQLGRVGIGLGLILLALELIVQAVRRSLRLMAYRLFSPHLPAISCWMR